MKAPWDHGIFPRHLDRSTAPVQWSGSVVPMKARDAADRRTIKPTRHPHRLASPKARGLGGARGVVDATDGPLERRRNDGECDSEWNSAEAEKSRDTGLPSGRPTTRCGSGNAATHCADVATTTTSSPRRPRPLASSTPLAEGGSINRSGAARRDIEMRREGG